MILNNLMEDKQLNFNQPLLSVRRSAMTSPEVVDWQKNDSSLPKIPALPVYKSDMKSGPIRNPGTVPFLWEQMPGRPKDESNSQKHSSERPSLAPKPPPGRIMIVKKQDLDEECEDEKHKLPQMRNVVSNSHKVSSINTSTRKEENSCHDMEENRISDSDTTDESYVDALDSLSRAESFYLNCSVSGVSGLDDPDVKPSGMFSTDPQTRDFMMGRFLPAAKAMASEPPQYATKKPPVAQEKLREVKKAMNVVKHDPVKRRQAKLNALVRQMQIEAEDSDDENDDSEKAGYLSDKLCGLFPRLCLKNSFLLMNPVPGLKMQTAVPISSGHRTQAKSIYASFSSGTESEFAADTHEQKSRGRHQNTNLHEDKIIHTNGHKKLDGLSLYRRLQGTDISSDGSRPCPLNTWKDKGTAHVPERTKCARENRPDSHRKGRSIFRELLASDGAESELLSLKPVVEKTLYIDSAHVMHSKDPSFSAPDAKDSTNHKGGDYTFSKKEVKETRSVDSPSQDIEHAKVVDAKKNLSPKTLLFEKPYFESSAKLDHDMQTDTMKCFKPKPNVFQDCSALTPLEVHDDAEIDLEKKQPKIPDEDSSCGLSFQLALPPLPNSPSESWLQRTLPSLSSKKSSSKSSFGVGDDVKIQASKTPLDPKWETIVKTSNVHNGRLRFYEELLAPIPEA